MKKTIPYLFISYSDTNIKVSVGKSFVALSMDAENDPELQEFLGVLDVAAIPGGDILWDILKEQLAEALKEILIDILPGGTVITVGPELLDNIRTGNYLDAMYNAVDIALNEADAFLPIAKTASLAFGIYDKYKLIKRVYKPLKEAKSLGNNFVTKLYQTLRQRFGVIELRGNFEWIGTINGVKHGSKLKGVKASDFFDDLKFEFSTGSSVFVGQNGQPIFKIADLFGNNSIFMELYPDSDTGYAFTIEFSEGPSNASIYSQLSTKFKIRFDE